MNGGNFKMIVVQISYGFGNQIFQYMYAVSLSKKFPNEKIMLENYHYEKQNHNFDIRKYQLSIFDNLKFDLIENNFFDNFFKFKKNSLRRIWQFKNYITFNDNNFFIIKNDSNKFIIFLSKFFKNKYYIGGWNNQNGLALHIRNEFNKLNVNSNVKKFFINTKWVEKIEKSNSIAICVRRSDYVKIGASSNLKYFDNAINFFNKKFSNNEYFVFSDDILWCKKNLSHIKNINFIDTNVDVPYEDLLLISRCKHAVISKSTFNVLGCYINDNPNKMIITERDWDINFNIGFKTLLLFKNLRVMCENLN